MELKGKIREIMQDFDTGNYILSFEIFNSSDVIRKNYDKYKLIEVLRITIEEWKNKRSLSANSYFHVLVGLLADATGNSKAKTKNELITSYGQIDFIDNNPVVFRTNLDPERVYENEFMHLKLTRCDSDDDGDWYWYRQYRGSHTYNTREMALLINCVVELARSMDIETKSDEEIERLIKAWKPKA